MDDDEGHLSIAEQETGFYETDEKDYPKAVCLPPKKHYGHLLRQTSLRNTGENSLELRSGHEIEADCEWIAVKTEKPSKVSEENDDCPHKSTEDENVKYRQYPEKNSTSKRTIQPVIPERQKDAEDGTSDLLENKSKLHPEENSNEVQEKHDFDESYADCTPDSLDQLPSKRLDEVKPQIYELENTQTDEDKLKEFIDNSTKEEVSHDNVDSGDIIEMDGMLRTLYNHWIVVEYKDGDFIKAYEYTLRRFSWLLLVIFTVFTLVFLDPIAMLVEKEESNYTIDQLKRRNARKVRFSDSNKQYVDWLVKNIERRKNEPISLYSPQWNNCEHQSLFRVCGISKSFQLDQSKIQLIVFILDLFYYIVAGIHLISTIKLASYYGISWMHTCWLHELYLACYQTYKPYELKKRGYITKAESDQEISLIWTRALVIPAFASLAGLFVNVHALPRILTLSIITKSLLRFCFKFFAIDLTLSWSSVVVCYVAWWILHGMLSAILWYIIVSLLTWIIKCTVVCLTLAMLLRNF